MLKISYLDYHSLSTTHVMLSPISTDSGESAIIAFAATVVEPRLFAMMM